MLFKRLFGTLVALTLACPAFATTPDEFRAMIWAGDLPGVKAVLQEAVASDLASTGNAQATRDLNSIFLESHPKVAAFTESWLAAEPNSAFALTARGWQLFAAGQNIRGTTASNEVYSDAARANAEKSTQAFELAERAIVADPGLLAASDLILRTSMMLGNRQMVPVEMERIMALHPNRGSLMRAMYNLSPQWGGKPGQVQLLCDRYAPMVKSIRGYNAQICMIDAAYWAGFSPGPQMDAAREGLAKTDNPVLDYARLKDAGDGFGTPEDRIRLLGDEATNRALTLKEAMELSVAYDQAAGNAGKIRLSELAQLQADEAVRLVVMADHDPYDPGIISNYVWALTNKPAGPLEPPERDEAVSRLKTLLHGSPYNAQGWLDLARISLMGYHDQVDLDRIASVEPFFTNAIVYSNYSYDAVKAIIWGKYFAVVDPTNNTKVIDMTGLSAEARVKLDRVVNCPLVQQMRILAAVCGAEGINQHDCGGFFGGPDVLMLRVVELHDSGSCTREFALTDGELAMRPAKIDF